MAAMLAAGVAVPAGAVIGAVVSPRWQRRRQVVVAVALHVVVIELLRRTVAAWNRFWFEVDDVRPLELVRIGVGRDAADVAFATVHAGSAKPTDMAVWIEHAEDLDEPYQPTVQAISTSER